MDHGGQISDCSDRIGTREPHPANSVLGGEHQVVEYGPVAFEKRKVQLWLPQSAEIYLDFRRHSYYRKHSFDHYMLFSVDADEKRKAPKEKPADTPPLQPN